MLNLLRNDFKRFIKDKTILVTLCLTIGYVIFSSILYIVVDVNVADDSSFTPNGVSLFIQAFNPASNIGFLVPMLLSIVIVKDFVNGTVRNKLICGKSRFQIYFSALITALTFGLFFYLLNAFLCLGTGSLLFGFGKNLTGAVAADLLITTGICSLVYLVYITIACTLAFILKNTGGTIVSILGVTLIFAIFATFAYNEALPEWLLWICRLVPQTQIDLISDGEMTARNFALGIICSIIYVPVLGFIGGMVFKKTDVK